MTVADPYASLDDDALAARLATDAGRLLLAVRDEVGFADRRALKAAGDTRAQEFLGPVLAAARPADAVLSEEAADGPERLRSERVWIVDPLDGTREFSEEGRTDWAVHVALWVRDGGTGRLAAGAVALPAHGITLSTARPPAVVPAAVPPRVIVSRTRPPAAAVAVAAGLGAELVPMGSAGAKIAAVLCGDAEVYVHAGGQYEWDSAAPVAVAHAAGLVATRLDGGPLLYNRPDPYLPDLLVCRPEFVARVREILDADASYLPG